MSWDLIYTWISGNLGSQYLGATLNVIYNADSGEGLAVMNSLVRCKVIMSAFGVFGELFHAFTKNREYIALFYCVVHSQV